MGIGALEGIEGVIHDSLCKEASMEVHENRFFDMIKNTVHKGSREIVVGWIGQALGQRKLADFAV